ncbi:MAG: hypothetical protein HYY20_13540 [Candidatus Tectomicrobia bacterium]|uniref:DUF3782 domain-containing protein n=1 Tax=Tectimicrobiota bacterium TaxID=2528274 RepID=A0A932CR25_UNCTE|nr:hypothetical protein [Candidatus Tectomicrobia bacterium]
MESALVLIDREALLAELRRVFDPQTAEALLSVLDRVAAQVRAMGVTHEDFAELRQIVAELAEAQRRTEERLDRLELVVEQLAEAQRRTEQLVAELAEAQRRTANIVGDLKGLILEANYRDKAVAYFGRWLLRPQVADMNSLWEALETCLSEEALDDVILLDLVVRGRPRRQPKAKEVWLAVEVSALIDREDVARARRRAALLRQAGYRAIPVAAGERATQGAEVGAHLHRVAMLQDGRSLFWEEALLAWAKEEE